VVTVLADGKTRANVTPGRAVTLSAVIEVPPDTGKVVSAEWSLEGGSEFVPAVFTTDTAGARARATITHSFGKPGTYFPVLRVASQRQGDAKTPYGRIQNLGRVRVVVR
jgi:hypothetical protein